MTDHTEPHRAGQIPTTLLRAHSPAATTPTPRDVWRVRAARNSATTSRPRPSQLTLTAVARLPKVHGHRQAAPSAEVDRVLAHFPPRVATLYAIGKVIFGAVASVSNAANRLSFC